MSSFEKAVRSTLTASIRKLAKEPQVSDKPSVEKEEKKKLGPLEHAYVADAVGARALTNAGRFVQEEAKKDDYPYKGLLDRLHIWGHGLNRDLGERVDRGASRLADSPLWRAVSLFDPTAHNSQPGIVELMAGVGGDPEKNEIAKQKATENYTRFLRKYQDKLDPVAEPTNRETPWHVGMQAQLADTDSDIAGHRYMRNERPLHYWLNPLAKSGPFQELGDRLYRRAISAYARPDTTMGRAGMILGAIPTAGILPLLAGGQSAQQKLRAAATKNQLYAPEAMPDMMPSRQASAPVKQAHQLDSLEQFGNVVQAVLQAGLKTRKLNA